MLSAYNSFVILLQHECFINENVNHLSPYNELKFKSVVSLGSQSPVLKKDFLSENKISLTIDTTHSFFRELQKAKCDFPELSFVWILNSQLKPVHLRQCKILEDRLGKICNEGSTIYKREDGSRQKRELNDQVKKLAVYETEIETVSNIYATVSKFEKDNVELAEKGRLLLNELNEANKKIAETEKVLSNNVTE
jgi:hypothetical protein